MNSALAFAPLTPADAAKVMKKCVRTLDNWCHDGVMPQPATLGGSRYWHPDLFYRWLDAKLKGQDWDGDLPDQAAPGAINPFEPLTREDAAKILKKTVRVLEDWYATGVMPKPAVIGGTRYWHPAIFFGWLNARLKGLAWTPAGAVSENGAPEPGLPDDEVKCANSKDTANSRTVDVDSKRRGKGDRASVSGRARARDAARLNAMNEFA